MTRIARDAAVPARLRGAPALVLLALVGCASSPAGLDLVDDAVDRSDEQGTEGDDDPNDAGESMVAADAATLDAALERGRMLDASRSTRSDAATGDGGRADGGREDTGEGMRITTLDGGVRGVNAPLGPGQSDAAIALSDLPAAQVGVIGDSYLALNGEVVRGLELNASAAGTIGPDQHYIDHSQSGASLAYPPSIATQFAELRAAAQASGGVKLVIMDGGGNDVLLFNQRCLDDWTVSADCRFVVDQGLRALKRLFGEMGDAGVRNVIYFWYPDLPGGGLGGARPWVINRYAAPLFQQACANAVDVKCHFLATAPLFAGHPEYISPVDRVHPTVAGSRAISDAIWRVMVDNSLDPG